MYSQQDGHIHFILIIFVLIILGVIVFAIRQWDRNVQLESRIERIEDKLQILDGRFTTFDLNRKP